MNSVGESIAAIATALDHAVHSVTRRRALAFSLSGCAGLLEGCGGSGGSTDQNLPEFEVWTINPVYLTAGVATSTFDLVPSLPRNVVRGGTFGVSPNGAALPAGTTLSPAGILAAVNAAAATVDGLVFTYTEPVG